MISIARLFPDHVYAFNYQQKKDVSLTLLSLYDKHFHTKKRELSFLKRDC